MTTTRSARREENTNRLLTKKNENQANLHRLPRTKKENPSGAQKKSTSRLFAESRNSPWCLLYIGVTTCKCRWSCSSQSRESPASIMTSVLRTAHPVSVALVAIAMFHQAATTIARLSGQWLMAPSTSSPT